MKPNLSLILILFLIGCSETSKKNEMVLDIKTVSKNVKPTFAQKDFNRKLDSESGKSIINIESIQLNSLPTELYDQIQATVIKMDCISFPCITKLSSKISQLKNLKELYIAKSSLIEIPTEIPTLSNLEILTIAGGGKLKSIPESFGDLINLQEVNLWRNNLSTLPSTITKLKNLKKINLIENNISKEERLKIKKHLPNCDIKFEY